uniref:HAT C-terminal dimerisation domain-containing protein n=1 Tax=Cajanus cajan TaxID=3821 RepID=A0A151S243_CAJCA|nr:hypothetical protein KK1_029433 [Cajanus cajan]
MVTDNAANYVAAGRLLEAEFPKLFWSPCAAHCINLMLQDMGKLEEVSIAVSHASNITKYVYNHCYALYLMRKHTGGREILRPAPTRFATNFIVLQSILAQKNALRAMVTSKEWTSSAYAKEAKAKKFVEQVLNSGILDQWWESYVCGAPNLQKLVIRVLSQTCSALGCERNWSVFEHIHSKKRNRLEHQKLNDLVLKKRHQSYDPINLQTVDDHSNWVMEDSPPFLTNEEVDALRNDLANITIQPISSDIGIFLYCYFIILYLLSLNLNL